MTDLSHLATVDGATGLCGLITPRNSLDWVSAILRLFVLSSYALRVVTGQRRGDPEKVGKKNSDLGLLLLDCFAKTAGLEGYSLWNVPSKLQIETTEVGTSRWSS